MQVRRDRDDVDNSQIEAMRKIDEAIEGGAFVGYQTGGWRTQATIVWDIGDEHEGSVVVLEGRYEWKIKDKLQLHLGASLSWGSDDYMEAYFGVDANNSLRSGLPVFEADSDVKDINLMFQAVYKFSKQWGIFGFVYYGKLRGDAEDSPVVDIVGDKDQVFTGLMAVYTY